jgi:hypothetical protein
MTPGAGYRSLEGSTNVAHERSHDDVRSESKIIPTGIALMIYCCSAPDTDASLCGERFAKGS